MPTLLFQVISVVFNIIIVIFVVYYILDLRSKRKEIENKESKISSDYNQVLDKSLTHQRQLLDSAANQSNQMMQIATQQANQILSGTQYISQTAKTSLEVALQRMIVDTQNSSSSSKIALDQALQKIILQVHKEAFDSGQEFAQSYNSTLKQMSTLSLNSFQTIAGSLELELSEQIKNFRQQLLGNLEKEVDEYKAQKIKRIEQVSSKVIQRVASETLNKTLSTDDQHALLLQSLERAKKEGIFD